MTRIYDFSVTKMDGQPQSLADYRGKVLLIVNTASYCGLTPQYVELQTLYEQYGSEKFVVLAFPCNQFGFQEPRDNAAIGQFCQRNYHVTFPVFAKIKVNGKHADPLFTYLKNQCTGVLGSTLIKWNFCKFLVDANGEVIKRYPPFMPPSCIASDIVSIHSRPHLSDDKATDR